MTAHAHFFDRLAAAVNSKGTPLCVGLDPRREQLPVELARRHSDNLAAGYEEFCLRVLDIVAPLVPIVKPQSAFFEAAGAEGFGALKAVMWRAKQLGLLTILDAKRGDIASTAAAYADTAFQYFDADSLTISPYLGRDSVEPFLQAARKDGRGLWLLVRTSNAGAGLFQDLPSAGRPLYRHVGDAVAAWGRENLGSAGFGDVGAVVGATHPVELEELRKALPDVWFLVPGYGAQGGSASDVAAAFRADGLGAVVNSSRGVTFPFRPDDRDWELRIELAARQAAQELSSSP